jgi:hypothetical protein
VDVISVSINVGAIPATADDAVHLVANFGETTGNQTYSGLDSQRTARIAVGLDTGFEAYPVVDPIIVADVTGNGLISGLDAQFSGRTCRGVPRTWEFRAWRRRVVQTTPARCGARGGRDRC